MCSFLWENDLLFFPVVFMQGGFVNSDIGLGCDYPTYNPSSVQILSLLTQFSGLITMQSLVSGEALQGAWSHLVLSLRSDDLICNLSFFKDQRCKGALSILTLSLGVITSHITPVLHGNWVAYSFFRLNNPVVLSCKRNIARGLDQTLSCLWVVTTLHITPVFQLSNVVRVSVWAGNICVKLQPKVTSSGTIVARLIFPRKRLGVVGRLSFESGQGMGVGILVPFDFWVVLGISNYAAMSGWGRGLENVGR